MRRVAHAIDADAADERVCRWLHEQAQSAAIARTAKDAPGAGDTTLVAVAMDGKVIRNTIAPGGTEGSEIKLFSALLHEQAIVIAQRRVRRGHQRDHPGGRPAGGGRPDECGGHRGCPRTPNTPPPRTSR
jgi:hypothetical protein